MFHRKSGVQRALAGGEEQRKAEKQGPDAGRSGGEGWLLAKAGSTDEVWSSLLLVEAKATRFASTVRASLQLATVDCEGGEVGEGMTAGGAVKRRENDKMIGKKTVTHAGRVSWAGSSETRVGIRSVSG